jgi:hypothetical protein
MIGGQRAWAARAVVATLLALAWIGSATPAHAAATCNGKAVTVDLNLGQSPTTGSDVILGTAGFARTGGCRRSAADAGPRGISRG